MALESIRNGEYTSKSDVYVEFFTTIREVNIPKSLLYLIPFVLGLELLVVSYFTFKESTLLLLLTDFFKQRRYLKVMFKSQKTSDLALIPLQHN